MTIQQLTYFREIAVTRNYTQAAANLYVAQPSISHSIQKLEDELNVPLFIRNPNKTIELTRYGKAFLPTAEKVLDTIREGTAEIEHLRNPYSGIVKIASAFASSYEPFLYLLQAFSATEHSRDIVLRPIVIHDAENFLSLLPSGDIDLLMAVNVSGSQIQSVPFIYEELMAYIPNSNPLSQAKSVKLSELEPFELLAPAQDAPLHEWILDMYRSEGLSPQVSVLDTTEKSNWDSLLSTIVYDQKKVCIFPRVPVRFKYITPVPIDHPMNSRPVSIAWATNRALSPAVRYVRDYIINLFKKQ